MPLVFLKGLNFKRIGARNLEGLRRVEDLRVGSLWKSLRTCEMRKWFPQVPFIKGEVELELSRSKSKEKYQPLDLHLTIGCREQSVA